MFIIQHPTHTNKYGEQETRWSSHKHPENPNFMQVVKYMHISKGDKNTLYWSLANSAAYDKHCIYNISLSEAISKFADIEEVELTEADFQAWIKLNQSN